MGNTDESCILCKSRDIYTSTRYSTKEFSIFRCNGCSLLFVGDKLSDLELQKNYQQNTDTVYTDPQNIDIYKFTFLELASLISQKAKIGKILDIGCSTAILLDCMPSWECYGIELNLPTAEIAKAKHGNKIHVGTLEDYKCEQEFFDVICLHDSLDHMLDPLRVLLKCYELLKPGGLIVITVHDISSLYAKLTGTKNYGFIPPDHTVYFNKESLSKALTLTGFEINEFRYLATKIFLKTIFNRLSKNNNKSFFYWIYETLNRSSLGNIIFKKNLYDVVTVFASK